jgi:hypothetical protein
MCRVKSAYQRHLSQEGTKRSAIADLPSGISVGPHEIGKLRYWRVRLGTRFTGGKRVEMHFPTLDKARKWIFGDAQRQKADAGSLLELKSRAGTAVFELSSVQVNEAINAFRRLGKVNMSLTEAVDFAIKHSRPDAGVISVEEAIEKALETKRSKRPSYIRDLRKRWSRFKEWLPAAKRKALNTIGQVDIRRYLTARKSNPQGERNELRNLSVLFSWTVQHHHMTANPCSGIKVEDSPSEEPVRVLSIAEIKHLLELAQMELHATLKVGKTKMSVIKVYPGEMVPWFVLGLFAGLRPEETLRLDWADIDFERRQIINSSCGFCADLIPRSMKSLGSDARFITPWQKFTLGPFAVITSLKRKSPDWWRLICMRLLPTPHCESASEKRPKGFCAITSTITGMTSTRSNTQKNRSTSV